MKKELEETIKPVLAAAIVSAMGDSEKLIQALVKEVLVKKKNSYDSDSTFMIYAKQQIQEAGKEAFGEWMEGKKAEIKAAMLRAFEADEGQLIKSIVSGLVLKLGKTEPHISVEIR